MNARADSLVHYDYVSLYETSFKTRTQDVTFFCELARELSGPVLEYGAGAGRVTLPLARQGLSVTAVEKSRPMMERLKAHLAHAPEETRGRVTTRLGDMRSLTVDGKFPVILATFNVVAHLRTFQDMSRFLRRVTAHLKKGGRLLFDVPIPHGDELEADPEELFKAPRFKHPDTKEWIRQTERFEYDPLTQELLVESHFKPEGARDGVTVPLVLRQWFPKELEAILKYEGFRTVETYADYTRDPGLMAQDTLIYCAGRD